MEQMTVKMGELVALAIAAFASGAFCGAALCMAGKLIDKHPEQDESHSATRYGK